MAAVRCLEFSKKNFKNCRYSTVNLVLVGIGV